MRNLWYYFTFCVFPIISMQQPLTPEVIQALNKKLVSAVKVDNYDWIRNLLAQGAQANYIIRTEGQLDRPVLIDAINNSQNPLVIKLLLDKGADPKLGVNPIITPVYALISRFINKRKLTEEQFIQMLSYLFDAGALINESAQKLINLNEIQLLVDRAMKKKIL